jgi:2'-5' RNA ligase
VAHHRLFAAFRPPATTRAALLTMMTGVPGARWQDDAQLHCTLRFIGEVDRHCTEDVTAALGKVRHPVMTLRLGSASVFERNGRVDTLWIGVQPRELVAALHARIERALHQVGIGPDARAFLPHITIARFARGSAPQSEIVSRIKASPTGAFEITHFELVESHLGSEGALYETIARYPLIRSAI